MLLLITIYMIKRLIRKLTAKSTILILVFVTPCLYAATAQTTWLRYKIILSGEQIGWIEVSRTVNDSVTKYTLVSEAKKRFIFLYTVTEKQECEFINSQLVASSVYRKVNGKIKISQSIIKTTNGYEVTSSGEKEQLNIGSINCTLISIYFDEPKATYIFSDNLQRYIRLEKKGDHCYKLDLTAGNNAMYYFSNGICYKVKVKYSWLNMEFVLDEPGRSLKQNAL